MSPFSLLNAIEDHFVPGMYSLGFSRYSVCVSSPQCCLCSCWHLCESQQPDLSSAPTVHGGWAQSCACFPFHGVALGTLVNRTFLGFLNITPFLIHCFFRCAMKIPAQKPDVLLSHFYFCFLSERIW